MARPSTRARSASDGLTIACKLPGGLHIKNPAHGLDLKLHGSHSPYEVAGHGMTRGVKADVWAKIKEVYADAAWLKNEFVFEATSPESANDKAEERQDEKAGFEPIDPEKLPRNIENGEVPM